MDNDCQVDVVYTDFSKAFDRIDHALLIERIRRFGFADDSVLFPRSYLSRREQYVFYNGFKSQPYLVCSWVPRGSNLGPLLFLLLVDDLLERLNCERLCFTDDLKIYFLIAYADDCY